MGRRSRRRQQARAKHVETVTVHGLSIRRRGRCVQFKRVDEAEHSAMRKALAEGLEQLEAETESRVSGLRELVAKYSLEVIAGAMFLLRSPMQISGDRGQRRDDPLAHTEYVLLARCLEPLDATETVVSPEEAQSLLDQVKHLYGNAVWLMIGKALRHHRHDERVWQELAYRTQLHTMLIRYPGYFQQEVDLLRRIAAQTDRRLLPALGWTIVDALLLFEALMAECERRFNEYYYAAQDAAYDIRDLVAARDVADGDHSDFIASIREMPPRRQREYVGRGISAWLLNVCREVVVYTASELAECSGLSLEITSRLLADFSFSPESVSPCYYSAPHLTSPFAVTPFISLADGRYVMATPGHLLWAIRPRIESLINEQRSAEKGSPEAWEAYKKTRSELVEQHAISLIAGLSGAQTHYGGLKYDHKGSGHVRECELDGLVLVDRVLFLIEAKSGSLTAAARRGAPSSMKQDIESLVGHAYSQAERALEHIRRDGRFKRAEGIVQITSADFDRVFLVNVSLEPLETFVSGLSRLQAAGVVGEEAPLWSVCLYDLEIIAASGIRPPEFVDYLDRRLHMDLGTPVVADDEMDWFGYYLATGMREATPGAKVLPHKVRLVGYDSGFNAHYEWDPRLDLPQPGVPELKAPKALRAAVAQLTEDGLPGYLQASTALLKLGWTRAKGFVRAVEKTARRARETNAMMTCSAEVAGHRIVFVCGPDQLVLEAAAAELAKRTEGNLAVLIRLTSSARFADHIVLRHESANCSAA